jgi:protein subunit release factor A
MYFEIEIDLQQMYQKVSKSIKEYQKVSKSIKKYQKVSKSIKKYHQMLLRSRLLSKYWLYQHCDVRHVNIKFYIVETNIIMSVPC